MIAAIVAGLLWMAATIGQTSAGEQSRDPGCNEWHQCREMALAAAERGEYERFHDLAWRAVQTGPPRDTDLMYLLARAQALSGRPHDALVMLDRLAEMGAWSDAETNDDFARTRELAGWPAVSARIAGMRAAAPPGSATAPSPPPSRAAAAPAATRKPDAPPAATPAAPPAPAVVDPPAAAAASPEPVPGAGEAIRFTSAPLAPVGLAYDAVSGRFVLGDRSGRKLIVVADRSNRPQDLVRADSAGFHDIAALQIDDRRGDLWVASSAAPDGSGTLHKLQLVSGRPLKAFTIPQATAPVNLVDLTITRGGTVLVLDAASGRILSLHPGAQNVETAAHINVSDPNSLAVGADDAVVYVAHRDGISLIDLRSRHAAAVAMPKDHRVATLRQIRWHRNALIGVADENGAARIVRLELNASGRAITRATTLASAEGMAGDACVTIAGEDLLYLTRNAASEFVAYRLHLR
jgi:hypothetical protein